MDNRIETKVEPDDEVEPYDGTYACLVCSDSVRGKPALKCWQCNSNPVHRACDKHSRCTEVCRTCGRRTVEVWKGASAGTAAIDLTGAGDGAAEVARLTERGAREDAVPAVSGAVAAPDGAGQGARGGRADAESGGSGKGKEPAQAEAGPMLRPVVRRQEGELRESWCCRRRRHGQGAHGQWLSKGSHRRGEQRRREWERPVWSQQWHTRQQGSESAGWRG